MEYTIKVEVPFKNKSSSNIIQGRLSYPTQQGLPRCIYVKKVMNEC
jgi:hypothetical protein